MKHAFYSIATLAFTMFLIMGCGGSANPIAVSQQHSSRDTGNIPDEYCGDATVVPLIAGRQYTVGEVTITNDEVYIYIDITTFDSWVLDETHAAVVGSVDDLPLNNGGNPRIGHYPYENHAMIELGDWVPGDNIVISVHAEVMKLNDAGEAIQQENAWGQGIQQSRGNRWMYFHYAVQDCDDGSSDCDYGWAATWGSTQSDIAQSVATDDEGYTYVCGQSSVTYANKDPWLRKYDPCGVMIWDFTWGGPYADYARKVAVDPSGCVYVIGSYRGTVDFNPGRDVYELVSAGMYDVFLSKFDSDGNFVWAESWGGALSDTGYSVCTDATHVYITGHIDNDIFIKKLDTSGAVVWENTLGGVYFDSGMGIVAADHGVYVTGMFRGVVDFDPDPIGEDLHTAVATQDGFLVSFDPVTGAFNWAADWGSVNPIGVVRTPGIAVDVDDLEQVYVTGYFEDTCDFDPDPATEYWEPTNGTSDAYLTQFDCSGNWHQVVTWGGVGSDNGYDLVASGNGTVYVTGMFSDVCDFDPMVSGNVQTSQGESDVYITRFDLMVPQWTRVWGGTKADGGYGIDLDGDGNIYASGYFSDRVEYAQAVECADPSDVHVSTGKEDAFLTKYMSDGCW
jgi:hypothetical protein